MEVVIDQPISLLVTFGVGDTGLSPEFEIRDETGAAIAGATFTNTGVFEIGGGSYGVEYTFASSGTPAFSIGDHGYIVWRRSGVDTDVVVESYSVVTTPGAVAALPGQRFYDRVTDQLGNAIPNVTVTVFEAGTSNVLTTATTDRRGEYNIVLTGNLALLALVDLQFSGGGIQTIKKEGIKLV